MQLRGLEKEENRMAKEGRCQATRQSRVLSYDSEAWSRGHRRSGTRFCSLFSSVPSLSETGTPPTPSQSNLVQPFAAAKV